MARAKKGTESFIGKIGNTVVYELNGQLVKRTIGISTKKRSEKQEAVLQQTSLITGLLRPVKEFIRLGFEMETKHTPLSPYNLATKIARLNAIAGIYPHQVIDYSKVALSRGRMAVQPEVKVRINHTGLEFSWDADFTGYGTRWNDRILMLAYIPEKRDAYFQLNGVRRNTGIDVLGIPRFNETVKIEVYAAFVSANRLMISDSVYLGQVIW